MTDIGKAIEALKEHNIESFDGHGILVIPASSPEDIYPMAEKARRIFKEIGFEKSWRVDPYYYDKKISLTGVMFDEDSQKLHAI